MTDTTKEKIRATLTKHFPPFRKNCPICNSVMEYKKWAKLRRSIRLKQTCRKCIVDSMKSNGHYTRMGRNSIKVQVESRRSKNEIYFSELCKKQFKTVLTNEPMFNDWDADVILPDYKLAILWNGKWHYEKITKKHSVKQVQNRDNIKIEEIKKMGYTPYIIKDMGKYNPKFVEEQFGKMVADHDLNVNMKL